MAYIEDADNVTCQACGHRSTVTDQDPRAGKFAVQIAFGRNQMSAGKLDETMITGYAIRIVDAHGNVYGDVLGRIGVKPKPTEDCCDPLAYSITVSGDWPTVDGAMVGGMFMITPYKTISTSQEFMMPLGTMTSVFADSTTGSVNIVPATLSLTVENPEKLVNDPSFHDVLAESIAQAMAGIEKEMIFIDSVSVARRLSGHGRRLAAGAIKVNYRIMLPADSTIDTAQLKSNPAQFIDTEKFKEALNKNGADRGLDVQATAPSLTIGDIEPASGTIETPTSVATPIAGVSSIIMALIIALAGRRLF